MTRTKRSLAGAFLAAAVATGAATPALADQHATIVTLKDSSATPVGTNDQHAT